MVSPQQTSHFSSASSENRRCCVSKKMLESRLPPAFARTLSSDTGMALPLAVEPPARGAIERASVNGMLSCQRTEGWDGGKEQGARSKERRQRSEDRAAEDRGQRIVVSGHLSFVKVGDLGGSGGERMGAEGGRGAGRYELALGGWWPAPGKGRASWQVKGCWPQ